jgi:hypothetical protein
LFLCGGFAFVLGNGILAVLRSLLHSKQLLFLLKTAIIFFIAAPEMDKNKDGTKRMHLLLVDP